MEIVKYFYCAFIFSPVLGALATTSCTIKDRDDCVYTIVCSEYAGTAYNPDCDYSEPYVTFIITNTERYSITSGFFGSTNFDSRVRIIKAIGNSWTNIEANTFRYYTKTTSIDLSNNRISDIKKDAFLNLYHLQSLNLSSNAIEKLTYTRTFSTSNNIQDNRLEVLDLSYNRLNSLSSVIFMNLLGLKKLYLQNNELAYLPDDCFSYIKSLTYLNLHENRLPSLNMTLVNLKSLIDLDLSNNDLTKLNAYETNRLEALETVNFSNNSIQFVESNCFSGLFNLETVNFSYNNITSVIESVMFMNSNKLRSINFFQNNITTIEDNAFKNNSLSYINLEENNLSGDVTENMFTGLQNITSLDLSNQKLSSIGKNAFSEMVNLVSLNISRNDIQFIDSSSFTGVNSLVILNISHNNISNINFLEGCLSNMTELYLRNNSISVIKKQFFYNKTHIKKLDLSMNKIFKIDKHSLPLTMLQELDISKNILAGVLKSNVFSPANFLVNLDLSGLKYTAIEENAFIDLPVLSRLNISHNEIQYVDPNNFRGMDKMLSLDVSFNKISSFYLSNSSLNNLKALHLNNNNLVNISRAFINMTNLIHVDLSHNYIEELTDIDLKSLLKLEVLHLSHNYIKQFNNPQINGLTKLTELRLSSNQLTNINLTFFKDLVEVDLSNNIISNINTTFFDELDALQALDVSHNNITIIAPGTFRNVKNLKFLNLSHNHITNLRYGSFKGLNEIQVLDLSYNKITEIDENVFHECVELKRLTVDYNYIQFLDVDKLMVILPELTSISLGGNQVSCKEIVRNIKTISKSMARQVEVTSIDKIYHEDNVHGIKCGDSFVTTTEKVNKIEPEASSSSGTIIWCTILTIMFVTAIVVVVWYKRRYIINYHRQSRLRLGNSMSFHESDFTS